MELGRTKKNTIKIEAKSETQYPFLPEEIIVRIDAKLLTKSLLRFKCVSKNWHSLLSDPKFKTQRQQLIVLSRWHQQQWRFSFSLIDDELSVEELPMPELLTCGVPKINGSFNGLLLVSVGGDWLLSNPPIKCDLLLWNPSTRCCNKVFLDYHSDDVDKEIISGLFQDSFTDDYKVLMGFSYSRPSDGDDSIMLGSIRNKAWTRIPFPSSKKKVKPRPVVNERLHWLVIESTGDDVSWPHLIVYFDPMTNEFVKLPMPELELQRERLNIEKSGVAGLGVLDGCLSMAFYRHSKWFSAQGVAEVFAMRKYGDESSWTSLFIIKDVIDFDLHVCLVPLCHTKNGEVLMEFERRWMSLTSLVCNPKNNTFRKWTIPTTNWRMEHIDASMLDESLLSPAN